MNHEYPKWRGFLLPWHWCWPRQGHWPSICRLPGPSGTRANGRRSRLFLASFNLFEVFGHGLGVVAIVLALHQLDPSRRWAIPRVLTCALGAGGWLTY